MSFAGSEYITTYTRNMGESYYEYDCAYCERPVSGIVIAHYHYVNDDVKWLICTSCGNGSVVSKFGRIVPSGGFGPKIEGLPELVQLAYEEARNCIAVRSFMAAEQVCRTILMYIAVEKGARERDTFDGYIDYLEENDYITPSMREWVKLIKDHGGKATHRIETPDETRAKNTLWFTAELLRIIYEIEYKAKEYRPKPIGIEWKGT